MLETEADQQTPKKKHSRDLSAINIIHENILKIGINTKDVN